MRPSLRLYFSRNISIFCRLWNNIALEMSMIFKTRQNLSIWNFVYFYLNTHIVWYKVKYLLYLIKIINFRINSSNYDWICIIYPHFKTCFCIKMIPFNETTGSSKNISLPVPSAFDQFILGFFRSHSVQKLFSHWWCIAISRIHKVSVKQRST